MTPENGFSEYKVFMLAQFADIKKDIADLQSYQVKTTIEIERLKIKASLWGAAAGSIPVMVFYFLKEISK